MIKNRVSVFNPFSPRCIVKFSQLKPILSLNKFEIFLLLIFSSLLCLISSRFLITKCLNFYVFCKEKLVVGY